MVFSHTVYCDWLTDPNRGHVGWYGYEPLKEEKKEKKKENKTVIKTVIKPTKEQKKKKKKIKWPTPEKLWTMNATETRKWLNRAADEAIGNPTEKNVERWLYYFQVAQKKALRFAAMWRWVIRKHPEFYASTANLSSMFSVSRAMYRMQKQVVENALKEGAEKYTVVAFIKHDDLGNVVRDVMNKIRRGTPELHVKYYYWPENAKEFLKYHVTYTPQIFVYNKKQGMVPVIAGAYSVKTMKRILAETFLVLEGKISPAEYFMAHERLWENYVGQPGSTTTSGNIPESLIPQAPALFR